MNFAPKSLTSIIVLGLGAASLFVAPRPAEAAEPSIVVVGLNAAGDPEPGFVGGGVSVFGLDQCGAVVPEDITIGTGTIFVTGMCGANASWQGGSFVVRLLANGAIDTTYGTGGVGRTNGVASNQAIVLDGGKAVVAGGFNGWLAISRLTTTGQLDPTFGPGGGALIDIPTLTGETATAIVRQADGKFVVAGTATHATFGSVFLIARFTSSGALDPTFSADGWDITEFPEGGIDVANDVAIGANQKIVVAGRTFNFGGVAPRFAAVRYTSVGKRDATFDVDGKVVLDIPNATMDTATSVGIDSAGRVVLGGWANFAEPQFVLARLTSGGALDVTFGNGGIRATDFISGTGEAIVDLSMLSSDAILACGDSTVNGQQQLAAAKFRSDGHRDVSWGVGSQMLVPVPGFDVDARAMAVTAGGKAFFVGRPN